MPNILEARFQFVRRQQETSDASVRCSWPAVNERTPVRRIPLFCVRWTERYPAGLVPRSHVEIEHRSACAFARELRQRGLDVTTYVRWIGDVA